MRFGEVNYAFTDRLTGTLGLRYTQRTGGNYATQVSRRRRSHGLPPATAAERCARTLDFPSAELHRGGRRGNFSGRANIGYQFTNDLFGYLSYAHGFRSGGSTCRVCPGCAEWPTLATAVIEDETNSTLEAGLKSTLRDGRRRLNLAATVPSVEDYRRT